MINKLNKIRSKLKPYQLLLSVNILFFIGSAIINFLTSKIELGFYQILTASWIFVSILNDLLIEKQKTIIKDYQNMIDEIETEQILLRPKIKAD